MDKLEERLQHLTIPDFYPLLMLTDTNTDDNSKIAEMVRLPLSIRETDIEYQFHRMILFQRYLESKYYPRIMPIYGSVICIPIYYIDFRT